MDGQLEVFKTSEDGEIFLSLLGGGTVVGEMALVEQAPRNASVRARSASKLLAIHFNQFDGLLSSSPSAARAMLHTVLERARETEVMLRQSEKMAQLGVLTAGVAHELNNPAAAVTRGAEQLQNASLGYEHVHMKLSREIASKGGQEVLEDLAAQVQARAAKPPELDSLARSDSEYELETWLEDRGVEDAWELAPLLVNLGYDPPRAYGADREFFI